MERAGAAFDWEGFIVQVGPLDGLSEGSVSGMVPYLATKGSPPAGTREGLTNTQFKQMNDFCRLRASIADTYLLGKVRLQQELGRIATSDRERVLMRAADAHLDVLHNALHMALTYATGLLYAMMCDPEVELSAASGLHSYVVQSVVHMQAAFRASRSLCRTLCIAEQKMVPLRSGRWRKEPVSADQVLFLPSNCSRVHRGQSSLHFIYRALVGSKEVETLSDLAYCSWHLHLYCMYMEYREVLRLQQKTLEVITGARSH